MNGKTGVITAKNGDDDLKNGVITAKVGR